MIRPSRLIGHIPGNHRATPILWFVVAYLLVVLLCLWLGGVLPRPTSSDIGWSD